MQNIEINNSSRKLQCNGAYIRQWHCICTKYSILPNKIQGGRMPHERTPRKSTQHNNRRRRCLKRDGAWHERMQGTSTNFMSGKHNLYASNVLVDKYYRHDPFRGKKTTHRGVDVSAAAWTLCCITNGSTVKGVLFPYAATGIHLQVTVLRCWSIFPNTLPLATNARWRKTHA